MKAVDFITRALKLSASAGEAERRTATSRAYYGAFHLGRELVEECGVCFSTTAETHDKLSAILERSQNDQLVEAARRLRSLRRNRNCADYDLDDASFAEPDVRISVTRAIEVDAIISSARRDWPAISGPIRAYAKDVLRLIAQDQNDQD